MNRSFFRAQFNFMKDAITKPRMGKFAGGVDQLKFEQINDALHDDVIGPALRIGAKLAVPIGLGIGAKMLYDHNQDMGHNTGAIAGGAIIGGVAGAAAFRAFGKGYNALGNLTKLGGGKPYNANLIKYGMPLAGAALGAIGGAAVGALGGSMAQAGAGAALAGVGIAAGIGVLAGAHALGFDPTFGARTALRAIGGTGGAIGAAAGIARGAATIGYQGLQGAERLARAVLTGSPVAAMKGKGASTMLDAWFPNFRNIKPIEVKDTMGLKGEYTYDRVQARRYMSRGMDRKEALERSKLKIGTTVHDPRRFAPNPRIIRRLSGAAALFAVGSAVHEAMAPKIAPPTIFSDGVSVRHTNDMGAGGEYGMGMLGANSSLNLDYQTASRLMAAAL